MTINEAARKRALWRGQSSIETCPHLTLELERNGEECHATSKYICILCGELVAQTSLAA